jgi:acetate kinase
MSPAAYYEHVLALNVGSSSLKFELFATQPEIRSRLRGAVRGIGRPRAVIAVDGLEAELSGRVDPAIAAGLVMDRVLEQRVVVGASGHRVVHGGDFTAAVRVTADVRRSLEALAALAPLHNGPALAVMQVVQDRLGEAPAVAVFDTAFFSGLPDPARVYAVPADWSADRSVRRRGFHGLAHESMCGRLTDRLGVCPGRLLTLQLGQGCSITALEDGVAVETSMGFTPLEGLIMGTRAGDLDPGVVIDRLRRGDSWQALEDALNRRSGLLGLSGVTDNVGELLALEGDGHASAALALAAFCHRLKKYIGAYAAVLGGIDALVFGGGIGENAPEIRARVCRGLGWLGLALDERANAGAVGTEARISTSSSRVAAYVVPVREEVAVARATLACLEGESKK